MTLYFIVDVLGGTAQENECVCGWTCGRALCAEGIPWLALHYGWLCLSVAKAHVDVKMTHATKFIQLLNKITLSLLE